MVVTAVLTGVAIGSVALVKAHRDGDLNGFLCGGECGPETVAAPAGLPLARLGSTAPDDARVPTADITRVTAALTAALTDPDLGPHVGVSVRDLASGTELIATSADQFIPASTTKLLTGFAARDLLDPARRLRTDTRLDGQTVVLVGGGDPYLLSDPPTEPTYPAPADLATLAERTAAALRERGLTTVALVYDASLFTGPAENPAWERSYVAQDIVTPTSALWVDRGIRGGQRDADPAAVAAAAFAQRLAARGVTVTGPPAAATASSAATPLAAVAGPTIGQVVDRVDLVSDNEAAEVVLRLLARATGRPGDIAGGVAAVTESLRAAGLDTSALVLTDGSGLSRANRVSASMMSALVATAAVDADDAGMIAGLPIAGFSGTLDDRFAEGGGGLVRAKTGTLTGVHSLVGVATTADGAQVAFAVLTDGTEAIAGADTQAAIDRLVTALTACTCAA